MISDDFKNGELIERVLAVIRKKLKDRSMTLSDLAVALNSTHPTISRMLNNQTRMTFDDLSDISTVLGVSTSSLVREAENAVQKIHIAPETEAWICGDFRVYAIFTLLNSSRTIDEISHLLSLEKLFVRKTISRFEEQKFISRAGSGIFTLTDIVKDISFGKTSEFYKLKSKIYEIQSSETFDTLSNGKDFWSNRDDSLSVARLTSSQVNSIARQLESISAQIKVMDQVNSTSEQYRADSGGLHAIFLCLKPFSIEVLRELIKEFKSK